MAIFTPANDALAIGQLDADLTDSQSVPQAQTPRPRQPNYLVDSQERAVYVFTADHRATGDAPAKSACYDACAKAWPPVTTQERPAAAGKASGKLVSTLARKGGELQVTYSGWPLYYFAKDRGKAKPAGQKIESFGGEWYLVTPSGRRIETDLSKTDARSQKPGTDGTISPEARK